jgi:hypothetical protein
MPACEFVDVEAEVYKLAVGGKNEEAEDAFQKLLPMINLENTCGMEFAKLVLVRRGVFNTSKMRNKTGPGSTSSTSANWMPGGNDFSRT